MRPFYQPRWRPLCYLLLSIPLPTSRHPTLSIRHSPLQRRSTSLSHRRFVRSSQTFPIDSALSARSLVIHSRICQSSILVPRLSLPLLDIRSSAKPSSTKITQVISYGPKNDYLCTISFETTILVSHGLTTNEVAFDPTSSPRSNSPSFHPPLGSNETSRFPPVSTKKSAISSRRSSKPVSTNTRTLCIDHDGSAS